VYKPEDHDDGEKTFLGHRGRFNADDIIDIVVQQPATARFLARHLYHFFVADECTGEGTCLEYCSAPGALAQYGESSTAGR
jgi:hypothetical protein